MTEAHAEYREPVAELLYNVDDNACVLGTTRTRGEYDSVGVELPDLVYSHLVVSDDPDIGLDFPYKLI